MSDSKRELGDQTGSAAVELVLLTPLLFSVLGLFVAAGILWFDHQVVGDAARSAAEAAATAVTPAAAGDLARTIARADISDSRPSCPNLSTAIDTSAFAAGGAVSVQVSCDAALLPLPFLPLPASVLVSARRSAPLEPYRLVGR